jgi:hypothetical protein
MSDNLVFGNPNRVMLGYLKRETYLDDLQNDFFKLPPPKNDSTEVQDELQEIMLLTDELAKNDFLQKRYELYDEDFEKYLVSVLEKQGIQKDSVKRIIQSLHDDIIPVLVKTKFYFQRIRPHTLAYYYNLPLYPFVSKTSFSPSYPSGHTFQIKVYCEVLGNIYPQFYHSLMGLAEDVAKSRIYMGLHYKSDVEFGKYMAQMVLSHPEFKKKYKL